MTDGQRLVAVLDSRFSRKVGIETKLDRSPLFNRYACYPLDHSIFSFGQALRYAKITDFYEFLASGTNEAISQNL